MTKLEVFKYKTRVDFNLECLQVMEFFGLHESFNTLLLVTQNEDMTDANEWTGIINTIKAFSRQGFKMLNKKIDANQKEMKT